MSGLAAAGVAERFHVYVLSDTSDPQIAAAEDAQFAAFAEAWARPPRASPIAAASVNTGFKAGNIRDFCERWGDRHELRRHARRRQLHDRRSRAAAGAHHAGESAASASCRGWWSACRRPARSRASSSSACGSACAPTPSAAPGGRATAAPIGATTPSLRLAPFIAHCHLPMLPYGGPLGGHVLSHDQVEAVLMRRAGYEVRVLPEEDLGWEENPPTLIEFIRRDLRWCQGNMQYWHFLVLPGIQAGQPLSARLRDADVRRLAGLDGAPGARHAGASHWRRARPHSSRGRRHDAARDRAGDVVRAEDRDRDRRADAPEAAARLRRRLPLPRQRARPRRSSSCCCRRSCGSATRCSSPGSCSAAPSAGSARPATTTRCRGRLRCSQLWPQTALGLACIGILAVTHPAAIPYALFIAGGLALSVPLAVVTALPRLGRAVRAHRPRPPAGGNRSAAALAALSLPAIEAAASAKRPSA